MFSRFVSGLFTVVAWLAKSALVKFAFYFALFFVATEFVQLIVPLLPGASGLQSAFAQQSEGVWYFLSMFKVGYGVTACIGAWVTRFIIRRIPVIG